jgi:hypothetical protein
MADDKYITGADGLPAASGLAVTDVIPIEQLVPTTPITRGATIDHLWDYFFPPRYKITPTITGGTAILVTITDMDGNTPSATNPIPFRVGDARYDLTASASFGAAAGGTRMNMGGAETAGQNVDLFLYAIAETGASAGLKFGFARIPYALTMGDFVNTLTNEKYIAGNYINFNSTDAVANIGRFRAQMSAGASYNWSIPSNVVVNRPIFETDWLTYTPQLTASSGTITTPGAVAGLYRVAYKDLECTHSGTITTNGTGTGGVRLSLPFTPGTTHIIWNGRENAVTGSQLQAIPSSNVMGYVTHVNGYPGGDGRQILGGGTVRMP